LSGDLEDFRFSLLEWFKSNGRHWIPWKLKPDGLIPKKGEALSVYGIWIAEVMLQQTQLKVVLPYWERWMKRFPTLIDLVTAEEQDVLLCWQGLGYYSRAKRIYKAGNILINLIGRSDCLNPYFWPKEIDIWLDLPGIGRSTAGSIISSAFDLPTPLLDGNLKRIFSRLSASQIPPNKNQISLWQISQNLIDKKYPRDFNQALMDLGARICTVNNPSCSICPISQHCLAFILYDSKDFPIKDLKKPIPVYVVGIAIVINSYGEVLIAQRSETTNMGGMWEFPGGKQEGKEPIKLTIAREIKEEVDIDISVGQQLIEFDHAYTHRKIHFVVHVCDLITGNAKPLASQQIRWVIPSKLNNYPFPAANSRIIAALNEYLLLGKQTTND